ncbi:MAG: helix-turn-helix transcriptional regulator [Alphaproteobacteria bacterium]|nr:helix-turn-helix transcriptional regulator [Alphaproteobacteria bacterium]
MVSHRDIWRALDTLAGRHGYSPSGLAVRAGLDSTAFNKSKRVSRDGRPRWPSTESIAKVLAVTATSFDDFAGLVGTESARTGARVPVLGLAQTGHSGFFDDAGFPKGTGWEEVDWPAIDAANVYALRITGDSMQPVYRPGDVIIVSPHAGARRGDRVVVKLTSGEVMAKQLGARSRERVELLSLNPAHEPLHVAADKVVWMARILWASQ